MPVPMRLGRGVVALSCFIAAAAGQTTAGPSSGSNENELSKQMQELRDALRDVRAELAETRRESQELRKDLDATRQQLAAQLGGATKTPVQPSGGLQPEADDQQVVEAKLSDLAQTKISSGSKYRVRVSGTALFNAATTRGAVDQIDLPQMARPVVIGGESGSVAATVRQSQVILEVFGPDWKGARTSGALSVDFFGGFPAAPEGVSTGVLRLRTASVMLDWQNDSLLAGQEGLLFSPRSPTSLLSFAYPAFSSAGNLWTWTPQIAVEHRWRWSDRSTVALRGGVMDPSTGELPRAEYDRLPNAGEQSRIPAYAARVGWERSAYDASAAFGVGAYYSRQHWLAGVNVDSWAASTDWEFPMGPKFWWSGELYRGRAIGGLGGGPNGSVLPINASAVAPIDSAGGWLQLKFIPAPKLEWNIAFGEDYAFFSGTGAFPATASGIPVTRNESGMLNFIYRPRSLLELSLEYRRLRTVRAAGPATADHVGLGAGIHF